MHAGASFLSLDTACLIFIRPEFFLFEKLLQSKRFEIQRHKSYRQFAQVLYSSMQTKKLLFFFPHRNYRKLFVQALINALFLWTPLYIFLVLRYFLFIVTWHLLIHDTATFITVVVGLEKFMIYLIAETVKYHHNQ